MISDSSDSSESEVVHHEIIRYGRRRIKLFSDDDLVPEEFQKNNLLTESIININKETVSEVFEMIQPEFAQTAYDVLTYTVIIRHFQVDSLLSLYSFLSKKYKYKLNEMQPIFVRKLLVARGIIQDQNEEKVSDDVDKILYNIKSINSIEAKIKNDDFESFLKITAEPQTNLNKRVNISNTVIEYVDDAYLNVSYMQLMAFFGSVKCFKHAILTGDYDLDNIQKYAIAGGNSEIIHILESKDISFDICFEVSVKYHRHELCDWLLAHYSCEKIELSHLIEWHNYKSFFFMVINSFSSSSSINFELLKAAETGNFEIVKYLYEKQGADIETQNYYEYTPVSVATINGHLDIVKYLIEECNVNTDTKDKYGCTLINNASKYGHLDIVKYLYHSIHPDIETKDEYGNTPLCNASFYGHLEIVKYLHEELHAKVDIINNFGFSPISTASIKGHDDIVKYLHETCHMEIQSNAVNEALRRKYCKITSRK